MTDIKWLALGVAAICVSAFVSIGVSESARYNARAECHANFSKSDRTAQEINSICK